LENNELLYNLQKYDIALKSAGHELDLLVKQKDEYESGVKNIENEIALCEQKIKARSAESVKLEKDAEFIETQIKKINERFLLIKTEKELSKYNAELAKLNSDKSQVEEKNLLMMEKQEKASAKLKKLKDEHGRKKIECSEKISDIQEKMNALNEEISKLKKHRGEFASGIPASAIEAYSKLAAAKNGIAVALVSKKICSGCHLSISDNTLNQVKFRNALVCCPNCQRIIYLE